MYRPEIKRKRSGAPVLSRKEIDVIGQNIVGDFMPEALKSPQEIDIDLLAQDYLGMDQDFQYLSHCGVYLGMTVFNDTDKVPVYDPQNNCADYISAKAHTVILDKTLLEENQVKQRYLVRIIGKIFFMQKLMSCLVSHRKTISVFLTR